MKFDDALRVVAGMTPEAMRKEIERLKCELRDRDARIATLQTTITGLEALLADRDAQIARLSADVAELKKVVEALLAQRGPGLRVPKGQGLLFANGDQAPDAQPEHDVDADDGCGSRIEWPGRLLPKERRATRGIPHHIVDK